CWSSCSKARRVDAETPQATSATATTIVSVKTMTSFVRKLTAILPLEPPVSPRLHHRPARAAEKRKVAHAVPSEGLAPSASKYSCQANGRESRTEGNTGRAQAREQVGRTPAPTRAFAKPLAGWLFIGREGGPRLAGGATRKGFGYRNPRADHLASLACSARPDRPRSPHCSRQRPSA